MEDQAPDVQALTTDQISGESVRVVEPSVQPPFDEPQGQDRPLELLLAGGALALGTLASVVAIAYKAWYSHDIAANTAILVAGLLFFIYAAGVYVFCYGWTRYDTAKAVRLTTVIVVLTGASVLIIGVGLALLAKARGPGQGGGAAKAGRGGLRANLAGAFRAFGSYVEEGELPAEEDGPPDDAAGSDLFTIACRGCGERYIPLPPTATCPSCGWTGVSAA